MDDRQQDHVDTNGQTTASRGCETDAALGATAAGAADLKAMDDELLGELSDDDPAEQAVFFALDEAAMKLEEDGGFEPFLVVVCGDELNIEEQEGNDDETIFASARQTLFQMERLADSYVFAYDGFVEMDEGTNDAVIVEWARKGDDEASVLAWLYQHHDDHLHFTEPLYSLGNSASLFSPQAEAASDAAVADPSVGQEVAESADGSATTGSGTPGKPNTGAGASLK
ncbi:MAG: hypothetical protein FWF71_03065 [Actinomycetia bacterium]|nr:hypothetical protein [Actinomycetes bacterium]